MGIVRRAGAFRPNQQWAAIGAQQDFAGKSFAGESKAAKSAPPLDLLGLHRVSLEQEPKRRWRRDSEPLWRHAPHSKTSEWQANFTGWSG